MYFFFKRLLDVTASFVVLFLSLPLLLGIFLAIKCFSDKGSVLYRGTRATTKGRAFHLLKFRTMVVDAEKIGGPSTAINDPRLTSIGRFLRKYKLDELPQLYNVLKGEMSFVGPRPIVTAELDKYGAAAGAYLAQKPGITGLWQVSGRNDVSYDERVAMDVDYAKRMTLKLDLELILRTGASVVGSTGR